MASASAASDWLRRGMRSFDATIALAVSWLTMHAMPHLDHTQGGGVPLADRGGKPVAARLR